MQEILSTMRKAVHRYDMIKDGDKIAVGLSGGKDSTMLILGLNRLKRFIGIDFDIVGITLDLGFGGKQMDYSPIEKLMEENEIEYVIKRTHIGEVVFDTREEKNPCSLCARMRRGSLHDAAKELGCNKIALGHHIDDALETFFLNLFNEGRVGCFSPVSYLSRKDLTMIRPLALTLERDIINVSNRENIPVVKNVCTIDGHTQRQATKVFLENLEKEKPGVRKRMFGALVRGDIDGWGDKKAK